MRSEDKWNLAGAAQRMFKSKSIQVKFKRMPSSSFFDLELLDFAYEIGKKEISQCRVIAQESGQTSVQMEEVYICWEMRFCGCRIYML